MIVKNALLKHLAPQVLKSTRLLLVRHNGNANTHAKVGSSFLGSSSLGFGSCF